MQEANEKEMTFWDHLDELRKVFFRIAIAVILLACIAFLNKELLFDIVLAPQRSDFILYRFFNRLAADFSMPSLQVEDFHLLVWLLLGEDVVDRLVLQYPLL